MGLGLKRNEVKLVKHNKEWSNEFSKVKNEIVDTLNISSDRVQHIGSTAIKNIVAKPVIDMLLGVDNLQKTEKGSFDLLQSLGFYRLKVERENEIVLAKFKDTTFKEKTHFIHMVNFEGEKWKNIIFFRDTLNSHPYLRDEYEDLKLSLNKDKTIGINEYTHGKEKFVNKIKSMGN